MKLLVLFKDQLSKVKLVVDCLEDLFIPRKDQVSSVVHRDRLRDSWFDFLSFSESTSIGGRFPCSLAKAIEHDIARHSLHLTGMNKSLMHIYKSE